VGERALLSASGSASSVSSQDSLKTFVSRFVVVGGKIFDALSSFDHLIFLFSFMLIPPA